MPKTIPVNQNQAHMLLLATERSQLPGLVGAKFMLKSLKAKLADRIQDRKNYVHLPEVTKELELEDTEAELLKGLWEAFDYGTIPRIDPVIAVTDSVDELMKTL